MTKIDSNNLMTRHCYKIQTRKQAQKHKRVTFTNETKKVTTIRITKSKDTATIVSDEIVEKERGKKKEREKSELNPQHAKKRSKILIKDQSYY